MNNPFVVIQQPEKRRSAVEIDPVCAMTVAPEHAAGTVGHEGRTYYFCSAGCAEKFRADPQKYLEPQPAAVTPAPVGTEYTCPMHPEVRRNAPGACPICGMALEPTAPAPDEPNPELRAMSRRFW